MSSFGPDRPDLRLGRPDSTPGYAHRRRPLSLIMWAVGILFVVVAVALAGYQWGSRRDVAQSSSVAPPTTGASRFSAADAGSASTRPSATTIAKPQVVGTLITRNKGSDQQPNRVFNAVGQGSTTEPRFVVPAGQRVQLKLLNRDNVVHSFTVNAARINVDVFAHSSEAVTFRTPLKPGTYAFYCRYRKVGMNGTLAVRRS
jgi:heme/copper-type cytochrome/quinol oxidase subunit 2